LSSNESTTRDTRPPRLAQIPPTVDQPRRGVAPGSASARDSECDPRGWPVINSSPPARKHVGGRRTHPTSRLSRRRSARRRGRSRRTTSPGGRPRRRSRPAGRAADSTPVITPRRARRGRRRPRVAASIRPWKMNSAPDERRKASHGPVDAEDQHARDDQQGAAEQQHRPVCAASRSAASTRESLADSVWRSRG